MMFQIPAFHSPLYRKCNFILTLIIGIFTMSKILKNLTIYQKR